MECDPEGWEVGWYLSRLETLTPSRAQKGFQAKAEVPWLLQLQLRTLAEAARGANCRTHCRNVNISSASVIGALLTKLLDAKLLI